MMSIMNNKENNSKIIASDPNFNIDYILIKHLDDSSIKEIIDISFDLKKIYGPNTFLTENNIHKYFNEKTLPFIAKHNNKIIGFIIGAPLEYFKNQSWTQYDENMEQENTLYTYAFVFKKAYRNKNAYAKTLKRVYTNWAKKKGFKYITGHVNKKRSSVINGNLEILKEFPIWYDSKVPFVYYRKKI